MKATSEELAIFVAVVESGSFSRAAEQLGQANSAVSRAVKKLEMKLGVSLLNRTTRQLSLTEEGERYFRRVQQILQEMAAAETTRRYLNSFRGEPAISRFDWPFTPSH
ncbi:LysR family transcriptional regulator, partial [Salmonella enterica subsp. enterica serovar Hadar]